MKRLDIKINRTIVTAPFKLERKDLNRRVEHNDQRDIFIGVAFSGLPCLLFALLKEFWFLMSSEQFDRENKGYVMNVLNLNFKGTN